MRYSDEDIREFIEAYRTDHGKVISAEEAREMLNVLVPLYELLYSPLPSERRRHDDQAPAS